MRENKTFFKPESFKSVVKNETIFCVCMRQSLMQNENWHQFIFKSPLALNF
jgi:hypothetical protein